MFLVYDIIYLLLLIVYLPVLLIRSKLHKGYGLRLGLIPKGLSDQLKQKSNVWIHAVSVGEVLAVIELIDRLKQRYPDKQIVLSTVTKTGLALAQTQLKDKAVVISAPLDFSWVVRMFINQIQPKVYIATETEIWPNLYAALAKQSVSIIQINGRISDEAFKGYQRGRWLTQKALKCVNVFCMQSQLDADRIETLGADKTKIRVVGNLKFDICPDQKQSSPAHTSLEPYKFLIAGSTHPGEEEIVIDLYKKLKHEFSDLRLIICPRHVERSSEIEKCIVQRGFQPLKYSKYNDEPLAQEMIMVVDTIGHLREIYRLATVVFIGKTFTAKGAQNMIEPAFFAKPVLLGPHTQNFKDAVQLFLKEQAMIQVQTPEEMFKELELLLKNPEKMQAMGQKARDIVIKYQGATMKTISAISEFLK